MSPDDAMAALGTIPGRLESVQAALESVELELKDERTARRRVIRRLAAAILVLAVAFGVYVAVTAASQASANRAQVRDLCLSGNEARAVSAEMWNYVITLDPSPATPAERGRLAEFEAHLRSVTAPRDCARISPRHP